VQEWVNDPDNRHWSHIIDGSIVDQAYVANRLRFRWHALKVTPAGVSDLAGDVAELPTLLFEEVADCARELLKTTCAEGREKGLQKSLNPFRTLRNKLEGLSFVDPLAAALAEGIDVVLNDIPAEGSLGATAMEKLRRLARKLSSPSSARAFAKAIRDGVSDEGTGDADVAAQANDFIVTLPQQPQPMPTTSPLPGPSVAPKAPSPVSEPLSPVEAVKEKDGDKQTKTASKPAAAPAAPVDVPVAAPAEAPAIPLTNDDLVVLFGEETRQLAPTFNVPEDLLRKAMGL
jgi:hypothetical protein